jgi:hypothetical protein
MLYVMPGKARGQRHRAAASFTQQIPGPRTVLLGAAAVTV